jgi:hypothetical protein
MIKSIIVAISIMFAGTSCSSPSSAAINAAKPGVFVDYIDSVEPRGNGVYGLWRRNDADVIYCISDKTLGEAVYKRIQEVDKDIPVIVVEYTNIIPVNSGCYGLERSYSKGANTYETYLVLNLDFLK